MEILAVGGTGYIGTHTIVELLNQGYTVITVDNLSNSSKKSLERVKEITGKDVTFYDIDIRNESGLEKVFSNHKIEAVIHFAGFKAVGESVEKPLEYYDNNVVGSITLFKTMRKFGVKKLVFSSSCTVYGAPETLPIDESTKLAQTNPYGRTKYFIEQIIQDWCISDRTLQVISLRYFNPVGAHESGKIGEDPKGVPNCLLPFVAQVAVGLRPHVNVFGNDYDTVDGTGVRDYIHVVELAKGHVIALDKLQEGHQIYNLGTGVGYSVLQVIEAMRKASGREIPYKIAPRRSGDVPEVYANPALANEKLGWKATKTLNEICEDIWRWQSQNPNGYSD